MGEMVRLRYMSVGQTYGGGVYGQKGREVVDCQSNEFQHCGAYLP